MELCTDCLTLPAEAAALRFFDAQPTDAEVKAVFEALLKDKQYEKLADIISLGSIVREAKDGYGTPAAATLDETYFGMFVGMAEKTGVDPELLYPMFVASLGAGGTLGKWKPSVENWFLRFAYRDFDAAADVISRLDRGCSLYNVLLAADRGKTISVVLGRLFGKDGDKAALRRFLLESKLDIVPYLAEEYAAGDAKRRLAVMRVLLIYKNDPRAARVIESAASSDTSKSVLKLIERDRGAREKQAEPADCKALFFDMMLTGKLMPAEMFYDLIAVDDTADTLFFTDDYGRVFIVDKGRTLDLDNRPIEISGSVGVLHPAALSAKLDYLKTLNISQCFNQINRTVYTPGAGETEYNRCDRLAGTVIPAGRLIKGLRKQRFRLLDTDKGIATQAGIVREGILCALSFSPADFKNDQAVMLGSVVFYRYADTVKLGGKVYTEGVRPVDIGSLKPRQYSEFLYSVYAATGLK